MTSLTIVDETDRIVGSSDYEHIHAEGLLHRFVSIFLLDENGRLLLQKRASLKPHGNLLSESVSGHVRHDENYLQAATRRLREELGLQEKLKDVCKIHVNTEEVQRKWKNNAFVMIYECITSKEILINPLEVQDAYFLSLYQVVEFLKTNPNVFVPGFKATFEAYLKNK
jgi:isopentenyl-diphosphate Delta-isomerase